MFMIQNFLFFQLSTKFVESDADAELLFNIPFSAHVRLTGLCISGDQDASHPARVKLYKDRPAVSNKFISKACLNSVCTLLFEFFK